MSEQQEKKPSRASGYFLIAIGILGIATRFIANNGWTTVAIIKVSVSVAALALGLWTVLKKNPQ